MILKRCKHIQYKSTHGYSVGSLEGATVGLDDGERVLNHSSQTQTKQEVDMLAHNLRTATSKNNISKCITIEYVRVGRGG